MLLHNTIRALSLLLGALLGAAESSAAPGPAGCGTGSWIAGTVDLCDGVLVYRDYVLDDFGATGGGTHRWNGGVLSVPRGGARYPEDQQDLPQTKYADLAALRLWIAGDRLHVSFELDALFTTGQTFAALAIDTDDNPATGGGVWGSLLASSPTSGAGIPLTSSGWEILHVFKQGDPDTTAIDVETNRIEGSIPLPPGTRWRLQAVTGITAGHNVFNVAFRSGENGWWFEANQAIALSAAGGGDISAFGATVSVADLLGGVTRRAEPGPGFYQRVYVSDYTVAQDPDTGALVYDSGAEGYTDGASSQGTSGLPGRRAAAGALGQFFSALGRYQPYGLYLPAGPAPHGLQLYLHGLSATHASQVEQPGMQQRFGEELNRILVAPLGRGPHGWYSDISERDVLDALADAEANYSVDPEQVFVSGYSMGGYGTFYFASLYPQRFAGFVDWVGYPGDGCERTPAHNTCPNGGPSNAYEFFENLEHIPGAMLYGADDELVNVQQGEAVRARFSELALPHIYYFHPGAEHFSFLAADDWAKEAAWSAGRTRAQQPAHVRYRAEPWVDAPALGIRHDRAYWLHDVVGRGAAEDEYFDVELTAFGCGGSVDETAVAFPAASGDDPVPWTSQEGIVTGQTALPVENRIEGHLLNVVSAAVDGTIAGACIDPATPLAYRLTTDGPTQITITGYRELALPGAGTHEGVLLPEPSTALGLAAGAVLLAVLAWRRNAARCRMAGS